MKLLLGVCGSISAYKTIDLARSLQRQGHEVKVILTKGALEFVKPEVFGYLGIKSYGPEDDFKQEGVLHIELARWCQALFIAPLSANTLSKLAHGSCDDLLTSVFLSLEKEKAKVLCPAMNTLMLSNELTQRNLKTLESIGCTVLDSNEGVLACGDVGKGKLPSINELSEILPLLVNPPVNKTVVVTAGSTVANIDSVRFITNPAKGGQGYVLAKEALKRGYRVHVIEGHDAMEDFKFLRKHPRYSYEKVNTTTDLLEAVKKLRPWWAYISPMAVSDIHIEPSKTKLKKAGLKKSLDFEIAPDVLKHVVDNRTPNQKVIGFAAESSLGDEVIKEKIQRKPVDLLVANEADGGLIVGSTQKGFGTRKGNYRFYGNGIDEIYLDLPKEEVAIKILDFLENK